MSFLFRSFAKKAESEGGERNGTQAVESLIHRIESVTLVADRRDGLRALKDLAKENRVIVATRGMDILLSILEQDRSDQEMVAVVLDILCIIMSDSEVLERANSKTAEKPDNDSLGAQFTEIFLKKSDHLALLLEFVKEFQFQIRWPAVRLMCTMAYNSPKAVQNTLLSVGGGISNIMDVLTDNREIIRNDGVLLLYFITKNDPSLQKIIAFGKAFEILLDIVRDEGCGEGGVVVEDCLLVISNLLANNASNIKLFKEDGCIHKLNMWFAADKTGSSAWSEQRKVNAVSLLNVIRNLVSPSLPSPIVRSCQEACSKSGLVAHVCDILMTPGVPLNVLVQTLNTVAELIRGNQKNQEDFSAMEAPLKPPRPALAILLLSMFNERQTFDLRLAVLYVLSAFLHKNPAMQLKVLQSVQPAGGNTPEYTLGQLLGGALFSADSMNQWCSAVAFIHCLAESVEHKKFLLGVEIIPSVALPASTLLERCGVILREGTQLQSKIGVLQLLCVWLTECPDAVDAFLRIESIMLILLTQILDSPLDPAQKLFQGLCAFLFGICIHYDRKSESRNEMLELLRSRIGLEVFREKIVEVTRHENFVKASQRPDPAVASQNDIFLDYDFIKFYKATEGKVCESLDQNDEDRVPSGAELFNQQRADLLARDEKIAALERDLSHSHSRLSETTRQIENLSQRVSLLTTEIQIRDQEIETLQRDSRQQQQHHHRQQNAPSAEMAEENRQLRLHVQHLDETVSQLQQNVDYFQSVVPELEQLRGLVSQQQQQITSYYSYFEGLKEGGDSNAALVMENADLASRISTLDSLLFSWQTEAGRVKDELESQKAEFLRKENAAEQVASELRRESEQKLVEAQDELLKLQTKYADLNLEQADLLELVTDSDQQLKVYRDRLRQLGEVVSDDDE
ncbi:General vesicular transport factor p115 [Hypsibius exemplaris]|uniref:General vesicular transport factor p115 n=1 Tax=Hypsibius exemplaris TaxID=2072580 RepID=A0A1W0X4V1_HYPEX|nr:General vesicular transport factor p115 [Hypsibius exemplaris]